MKGKRALTMAACAALFCAAHAQELTGYEIMRRARDVPEPRTSSYTATMTLVNKKGSVRTREVLMRTKDYGDTEKSVIVFTTPKDVSGVAYLMFEYDERADGTTPDSDNWLYMPAAKKTRRITGSGKSDDFMGTDFTYEDMGERSLSKDTYTLLGEETVGGAACWKINAASKDRTEKNPRRVLWVRKDSYLLQRAEFYDRQDMLQRELSCSDIVQVDGYWTTRKMVMRNVQSDHTTTIEMKDVSYDIPLEDSLFTVAALERGSIR